MIERLFESAVRPFVGSGIGRIKPLAKLYQKMANKILPNEKVIEIHGFKIKVVTQGHIGDISTELLFKGVHEPLSTKIFKRYIENGNCVLDIGANIGYYTLLSARLVGETGRVFAFEPDISNMKELLGNVKLNNFQNVRPNLMALADYDGQSKLFLSSTESARHSLIETKEHNGSVMVTIAKLDSVIPSNLPVHFLKTDTEGNELAVLQGAKETINRNFKIKMLVEVNPDALYTLRVAIADVWDYIFTDLFMKYIYIVDDYKQVMFQVKSHLKVAAYCRKSKLGCNMLCSREKLLII